MSDPDRPWEIIPPEKWERLLAVVSVETGFEPSEAGQDAGLTEEQIEALTAWCAHVEHEDEVRRRSGDTLSHDEALRRIDAHFSRLDREQKNR